MVHCVVRCNGNPTSRHWPLNAWERPFCSLCYRDLGEGQQDGRAVKSNRKVVDLSCSSDTEGVVWTAGVGL